MSSPHAIPGVEHRGEARIAPAAEGGDVAMFVRAGAIQQAADADLVLNADQAEHDLPCKRAQHACAARNAGELHCPHDLAGAVPYLVGDPVLLCH
jgi:hypothetical protein